MDRSMVHREPRDPDDREYQWSRTILVANPDVVDFINSLGVKYRFYERKAKTKSFGRPRYKLAVRFNYESRYQAALFMAQWNIPKSSVLTITRVELSDERTSRGYGLV